MNKLGSMLENWYSQPTISVGFISTNSTNCRSKIFVKKKILEGSKEQNLNLLSTKHYTESTRSDM